MGLRKLTICLAFAAVVCPAQQPVAPTPDSVGPPAGKNWSDYNIINSLETGYRFVSVSGNEDKYRSTENFGNGVRLLSGFFSLNSKDGHAPLFDQLVVTIGGLGGDPYESATMRVAKNRIYEYKSYWRKNDYLNPGLTTDGGHGQNLLDTSYTMQDHDLTLYPESNARFTVGYTRSVQNGAGISSVPLFNTTGPGDLNGGIFPIFSNVRIVQSEYRLGTELHWRGYTLHVLHGWQDFKDDTPYNFTAASNAAASPDSLSSFLRTTTNHGTSPYWQVALFRTTRWFSVNGRFTYTGGVRDFRNAETPLGVNQFGALSNQQIITTGDARRPVATGNANATLKPTSKLTVASRVSIFNVRTEGNSAYLQYNNTTQSENIIYFQRLGIRTIETDVDAQYQFRTWLDVHGGYGYSDRRIAASPQFATEGGATFTPYLQTSLMKSGSFGFRVSPIKGLTASIDGEVGRANRPFTPKSEENYTTLSGRVHYRLSRFTFTAVTQSDYNLNSVTLSSYSSHARTYSGSVSWNAGSGFGVDASFSKLHVDTLGGVAFFVNSQAFPNQVSYYVSNLSSGVLGVRYEIKHLDLYFGYNHVQDAGDGRTSATTAVVGPNLSPFQTAQTFPLRFLAPMGRASVRISERIRWNVGYQYYGYDERFFNEQNYKAHTGYTSILWSF